IGDLQVVGGAHFVERTSLLRFLDAMIAAPSVDEALRARMLEAEPLRGRSRCALPCPTISAMPECLICRRTPP
ncbi:MAG: hypothetical protein ACRYFU_25655, partial [Janthinobacterium lividum]